MINRVLFILIFCLTQGFISAQEWELKDSLRIEIRDSITDFGADDFNNLYYIRNFSELNKIDFRTRKSKSFSNGTVLENLNTQNILEITVKSGLFNLLVLDNQLNPVMDPIRFPMDFDFSPTLMAVVDNNYFWGYDPVIQRLVLWNFREKKTMRQSVILSEKSADGYFNELIYTKNKIYLFSDTKILIFDEYANLEKIIPVEKFDQLTVKGRELYYSIEGKLYSRNFNTEVIKEQNLPFSFDRFSINEHYLFVLKDKVVYIYEPKN